MNKNKIKKETADKKGFTLIELLMTIAVIGILSTVIIISMVNGKRQKQVEVDGRRVASTIRLAQNYALSGFTSMPGVALCGAGVDFDRSGVNKKYIIYGNRCDMACGLDPQCPYKFDPVSSINIGEYSLEGGDEFHAMVGNVYFDVPHAVAYQDGNAIADNLPASINLSYDGGATVYKLCLLKSGVVEEKGIGGSCP